jgi:hypothetical protein
MEDVTLFQVITVFIAVLGLGLSIYSIYTQRNDKQPSIKITTSSSIIATPGFGITSPQFFTTTAMNTGHTPVHLSGCGLRLPNGKTLQFVGPDEYTSKSLPITLSPGQSIPISRVLENVIGDLQREGYSGTISVHSYFRDEINNTWESKKVKFKVSE